jgi:endonuclease/exonuclease/phosphatase family metal-dependent hydrolase
MQSTAFLCTMRCGMNLRVMTYNVHSCIGNDRVLSPTRIAEVIAAYNPDVVALQELDVGRARTGNVDQAHLIAQRLEYVFHFFPGMEIEEERFGDAILSRYHMHLRHAAGLPRHQYRSKRTHRGALWVSMEVDGRTVQIINTHLGLGRVERRSQTERLLSDEWLGHKDCTSPLIFCGDLNSLPRSFVHRQYKSILHDTQPFLHGSRARSKNTYPSPYPMWRIDYIFVSPDIRVTNVIVPRTRLTRLASDHLPVIADLEIP